MTPDAETEEFSGRGFLFPNAFSLSRVFITAALGGVVTPDKHRDGPKRSLA
jgi:hypothetical protein